MKKTEKEKEAKTRARKKIDSGVRVVNVLGTDYTIEERTAKEDPKLEGACGYCDPTVKRIVLLKELESHSSLNVENEKDLKKTTLRHELTHAFLESSGLNSNYLKDTEELIVEWIAIQFPKMLKVFKEVGAL